MALAHYCSTLLREQSLCNLTLVHLPQDIFKFDDALSLFPFAEYHLHVLRRGLQVTRRAVFAAGMHKNHQTQWRVFLLFCSYFQLTPMPASLETLALYCQFLSRSMIPAPVRNYLSGVKLLYLSAGKDNTLFKNYELTITLGGLERLSQHVPNMAPPVTKVILLQLVLLVNLTNPVDASFMSAFLCMFLLLARVSK